MTKGSDITKANGNITYFCEEYDAKFSISNKKGLWTGRMTRNGVQVFLVTGSSIIDCMINSAERVLQIRKSTGTTV